MQEDAVQLASYSIAFDACFGREGAAEAVAAASSSGRRLEMSEGGEEGSFRKLGLVFCNYVH